MSDPSFKSENYANFGGVNTKISSYITGKEEFLKLYNLDFRTPGALTKRYGSTQSVSATLTGKITGLYEFERLSGFSQVIVTANTNAYYVASNAFTAFRTNLENNALFDFVTFVDRLFAANGGSLGFFKWDGQSSSLYGLPVGATQGLYATFTGAGSMTGTFLYSYGYLNDRGYFGGIGGAFTLAVSGATEVRVSGFTIPQDYGITSIILYRSLANQQQLFRIGSVTSAGATFVDTNLTPTTIPGPESIWFTQTPKFMEIYNNQLFMAGFSLNLSTTWFSDIGEPESVQLENNFEVRTNDGDKITALKIYNGNLYIFKERSFHQLSGDDPETFLLREVSDQYGALSNRAVIVYEDYLLFLDRKGIVQFNGANLNVVSTKIEPIFLGMNITAAKDQAVAIHHRLANEVWFGIPCNGASFNNCTVVYNYEVDAWSVYDGFNPSSLAVIRGPLSLPAPWYGSYTGTIYNFGASLFSDNGVGFSCVAQTRFLGELGKSTTEQFRRLYLDMTPFTGATQGVTCTFYADYGASIQVQRTIVPNQFQTRVDFGIPAKALSVEMFHLSATDPLQINGFTIEARKQRDV